MDLYNRLQAALPHLDSGHQVVSLNLAEIAVDQWQLTLEYEDGITRETEIDADGPAAAFLAWLQAQTATQAYDSHEVDYIPNPTPATP